MELANTLAPPSAFATEGPQDRLAAETNTMDVDMDIDIDLGTGDAIAEDEASMHVEPPAETENKDEEESEYPTGDVSTVPALDKVNIRGLDELATDDIKAFAAEHCPSRQLSRVEWVDDTSANIVYPSTEAAKEALTNFSDNNEPDSEQSPSQLRRAKQLSSHPDVVLYVRQATLGDIKKPKAYLSSRFYLMNPDKDPEERRRRRDLRRGARDRDDRGSKRRREDRDEEDNVPFDVNMYDDDEESLAKRRDNERGSKRVRFGRSRSGDLFADRMSRKDLDESLRNRSASPARLHDGDGRFGFTDDDHGPTAPSYRNRSKPGSHLDDYDLMAGVGSRARSILGASTRADAVELFPARTSPLKDSNAGKELFANGASALHRRTDAFDAADETADVFPRADTEAAKSRSLADRITGGSTLPDEKGAGGANGGMTVKGSVHQAEEDNPGFSIKGVARGVNPRVRELFPERKDDNNGKELFGRPDGKVVPRRRKAEDLFS